MAVQTSIAVKEECQPISKVPKKTRTNITCVDCGTVREVATQDAFQVKRCKACQKRHRSRQRRLARKEKMYALQAEILKLRRVIKKKK